MNRTFFAKLRVVQQVKFAVFYVNGRFVTLFIRAHHCPRPDSNESSPYSYTLKLILIVSQLRLRFLLSLGPPFSSFFHNFVLIAVCLHICYMPSPSHPLWFDYCDDISWSVKIILFLVIFFQFLCEFVCVCVCLCVCCLLVALLVARWLQREVQLSVVSTDQILTSAECNTSHWMILIA
jgi:hypothetical protein